MKSERVLCIARTRTQAQELSLLVWDSSNSITWEIIFCLCTSNSVVARKGLLLDVFLAQLSETILCSCVVKLLVLLLPWNEDDSKMQKH